jgi:hypothetical protein
MILEIRPIDLETEYDIFKKWWKAHGWDAVAPAVLPNFGYVVCDSDSGRMFAAGWAYMDKNTPIGFIEWLVTNPDNSPRESIKTLKVIIDGMTKMFERSGKLAVLVSTKSEGLVKLFKKAGYSVTDSGMTHLAQTFNQDGGK